MKASAAGGTGRKAAKRRVVWRRGAEAIERLGGRRVYVCPLCLRSFAENQLGELTLEDVPPKGLSRRPFVLTCKECNEKAGHDLDHHAITEDQLFRVASGQAYRRNPARLSYRSLDVNAELSHDGDINTIRVLPHNAPGRAEALRDTAEEWGDGTEFTLTFRRQFDPRRSQISWLRAGYLLAFAWLGYRYILRAALEKIRIQIRDPERRHIDGFFSFDPGAEARRLSVIKEPAEARGIAITAYGRIVLLPLFDQDKDLYIRIVRLARQSRQSLNLQGRSFGWPDKAIYRLDHCTPGELTAFCALRF